MKTGIVIVLTALTLSGCAFMPKPVRYLWPWEPLPSWKAEIISPDQVPRRVARAAAEALPDVSIQKVERSTFCSRLKGYPKRYRYTVVGKSNTVEMAVFDERGEPASAEMWFHETDIENTGNPTSP